MNLERLRSTTLPSVLLATSLAVPAAITNGCADTRGEILEVDLNALGFSIDGSRPRSLLVSASFLGNDAQSSCDTSTAVFSFEDLEDMDASRYLFPDGCPTSGGGFVTEFGVGGSDIQGDIIEDAETDVEYWGDAVGRVEAEIHISTPLDATFSIGGDISCDALEDGGACTVTPDEASD